MIITEFIMVNYQLEATMSKSKAFDLVIQFLVFTIFLAGASVCVLAVAALVKYVFFS
jgi:hypothetical protein